MKTKIIITVSALSLSLMTGCSSKSNSGGPTPAINSQQGTPISANPAADWQTVTSQVNSSVAGGNYNQYPLIKVDTASQSLILYIPMPPLSLGSITPILPTNVTGMPGVTIGPATMPGGGIGWGVTVPLKYILKGATMAPLNMTLPNGSPLPYFPAAETHGIALTLPQQPTYKLTLYIALKAVAVFVEVPDQNIPLGFGYNIVNSQKTRNIGYFAILPNQGTYAGGVYIAAQLPTDIALLLNGLVSF